MSALLLFPALFVGFVAFSGFLLGQLFSGHFSMTATLAGLGGLCCAACALKMSSQPTWAPAKVYGACVVALLGVAMEATMHHLQYDTPGHDYAWHIVGPYAACIMLFAYVANRRRASGRTGA